MIRAIAQEGRIASGEHAPPAAEPAAGPPFREAKPKTGPPARAEQAAAKKKGKVSKGVRFHHPEVAIIPPRPYDDGPGPGVDAPAFLEPRVSAEEDVVVPDELLTPSLLRLRKRLASKVELYKLHLTHYHVSSAQFKRRTSELALPDMITKKYEEVVKQRAECQRAAIFQPRSRLSGIRASGFGDLLFIDRAEVKYGGRTFLVLLALDAATNLLVAYPQTDKQDATAIGCLRD